MGCPAHDKDRDRPPCPTTCLREVIVEACLIVGSYAALSYMLEDGACSLRGVLMFLAIFIPISFVLRCVNVDYKDQLARVALFQLGVKIFNVLT